MKAITTKMITMILIPFILFSFLKGKEKSKEKSKEKIQSGFNFVKAAQAEYDFLNLIEEHPVLYSENVLRNALYRYKNYWLPLASKYNELLSAPLDIEWVWHCHLLNPVAYKHDCLQLVGKVVNHSVYLLTNSQKYWADEYPAIPF